MNVDPDSPSPNSGKKKYTGKRLVVLRDSGTSKSITDQAHNVSLRLASSNDYLGGTKNHEDAFRNADGIIFEKLGVAVINENHDDQIKNLAESAKNKETFLYSEPERYLYTLNNQRGSLWQRICAIFFGKKSPAPPIKNTSFQDDATAYWGIHAVKAIASHFTGKGIKLAVLDTGFNLTHPDFLDRTIVSESFIDGESVDDLNGHGTHCIGIAVSGKNQKNNVRYGVARDAAIYVGKVLSDAGSGTDSSILAGMEWALLNHCKIISMSLGASVSEGEPYSRIYNDLAKRLMDEGILIIAAAGNDSNRSSGILRPVSHPANCPNIMAVGALDSKLKMADFSCAGINDEGGEVDIAAPGVDIFSSYKSPKDYGFLSGTSMATPFVAGLAALLWEEFPEASPIEIWKKLQENAYKLQHPARDVGAGLAQAISLK